MSLEEYLDQLDRDIQMREQTIADTQKKTDEILMQAAAVVPSPEHLIIEPETATRILKSPQMMKEPKTQEERDYQQRIQAMAKQLAQQGGVDEQVLKNMGPDAEIQYLRTRNQQLEKIVQTQNADYQKLLTSSTENKSQLTIAQVQRDKLQKQLTIQNQKLTQLQQQNDNFKNNIASLQAEITELSQKTDQVQRVAQNGATAANTKEKQIGRLIDQIENYKKQLNESVEREVILKKKYEEIGSENGAELKKTEREKEELLSIVKKQQQLIDVLQRQKLHLQGAIQLGFTETEFQKILEK
ncbi:Conserved_hypothetical protein [Hexamita inflata]|uniref:Uncharacterized protein n=1 Tax=Hexamita inflata TaxID=28002 RepID=A0AA86TRW8_9EUKA|nr:Conserved hypothetical protein [Hexamita inflata]